ncbi:MAG TPA: chemotaxis protein CheW, partial [Candidatus Omnitrophota bacterium]|nr:chemotaxis protein CheW [Candidatus Omnitrophota bacterium]
NVVPVFDLRKRFGLTEKPFNNLTKILVASVDHIMISVVVDEILENVKLETAQIDPAPTVRMKVERECVMGIGELEGRMITILDLPKTHEFIMKDIRIGGVKGR